MTLFTAVQAIYAYNQSATAHLLDTAEALTQDQFEAIVVEEQRSIRDTLVHLCNTQRIHLAWWDGSMSGEDSFARHVVPSTFPTLHNVRAFWQPIAADTEQFLASLTSDADFERICTRRTRVDATVREVPLWHSMLHVANHGTQHRSEVALMLTALGHSPGDLELL